jgi:predicted RNA-binding Zn ribbon-like protein
MKPADGDNDRLDIDRLVRKSLELKPAPVPLRDIQKFLNSRNLLGGYDLLSDESTARMWLAAINTEVGEDCDGAAVAQLRDLREAMRELLSSHATGETPKRAALRVLRSAGAGTRLKVDVDSAGRPRLLAPSDSRGTRRVIDDVMTALAAAPPDQLQRLKACVNPGCGWVFYDTSRSHSGTWCLMNVCGARHKMERYRSRRPGSASSG